MRVCSITLEGFRNYEHFSAQFHPGVNVIWGENAQGKTNLLEAIGFLSGARSHRARGGSGAHLLPAGPGDRHRPGREPGAGLSH